MENNNKTINYLLHTNINDCRIVVNYQDYNSLVEQRILIPFIHFSKWGLMNKDGDIIVDAKYDIVYDNCSKPDDLLRVGVLYPYGYPRANNGVSSYVRYRYGVVDSNGKELIRPEYDCVMCSTNNKLITLQDRSKGYCVVDRKGNDIIPYREYSWIDGFDKGLARVKVNNKWGIINEKGKVVLPIEYDNIWNFYRKNKTCTLVTKDNCSHDVDLLVLNGTKVPENDMDDYTDDSDFRDHESYSIEDSLMDALDGEPEAYWNID